MSTIVTVFTKEDYCPSCDNTKKFLNNKKVDFVEKELKSSELAMSLIEKYQILQAPITIVQNADNGEVVFVTSGFNVPKLKELVNTQATFSMVENDEIWDF